MEKSLSLKLAARKRIRYTTLLAGLVLVCMLGSMIIVKNPNGGKAATLLTQTLPHELAGASVVLDSGSNTTYLMGGSLDAPIDDSDYFRGIYKVDMNFATDPIDIGPGTTVPGTLCLKVRNAASVYNPYTHRAYLISGSTLRSGTQGVTKNIAEVDLTDQNIADADIKCTQIGPDSNSTAPLGTNTLNVVDSVLGSGDYNSFIGRLNTATFFNPLTQKIYIVGGRSGSYLSGIFDTIYELDTSTPGNLTIKKLTSSDVSGLDFLSLRKEYSSVFDPVGQKAYFFGGRKCVNPHVDDFTCDNSLVDSQVSNSPYISANNDILQFDLNSNIITALTYNGSAFSATVPAQALFDPESRTAYIMPGMPNPYRYIYSPGNIVKFDIQNNTVSDTGRAKLPVNGFSAVVYNGRIYTFGGTNLNIGTDMYTGSIYVKGIYAIDVSESTSNTVPDNLKVNKKLLPRVRNGANNEDFNPYALQKGDIVKVQIDILDAESNSHIAIYDDALNTMGGSGTAKCDPADADALAVGSPTTGWAFTDNVYGGKTVIWGNLATDSSGNAQVSYYCKATE